jgi:hypothetical protein
MLTLTGLVIGLGEAVALAGVIRTQLLATKRFDRPDTLNRSAAVD